MNTIPLTLELFHCPVSELPSNLYKKLRDFNMRNFGDMMNSYYSARRFPSEYPSITVICHLPKLNMVFGHALLYREYGKSYLHFYVRKDWRKAGIGNALMKEAINLIMAYRKTFKGKIVLSAWDNTSYEFFRKWNKSYPDLFYCNNFFIHSQ